MDGCMQYQHVPSPTLPVGGVSLTGEEGGGGLVTLGGGAGLGRAGDVAELTTLMLLVVNLVGELGGAGGEEKLRRIYMEDTQIHISL